ncbi:hypothetical protein [Pseudonocardia humida]|uniref:Uncharacterized protein n=1 Tax=Pseudonocardia humida TaxID=2800819 RepID=A0ABT0ZTQ9_9PSEU|nr:hypothetical protein [Pseudonocardia humida]MCO1654117.1 hypothetical protein [Pseudonocardia humida]
MDGNALVAALGQETAASVRGYRERVLREAARRGLRLDDRGGVREATLLGIRLAFGFCRDRPELTGRTLSWGPAHGWSLSHRTAGGPPAHYAGPGATPRCLVPEPADVVEWAVGEPAGSASPPRGVELDDDPVAIRRLLRFARRAEAPAAP